MIGIEIQTLELEEYLSTVQMQVYTMRNTLMTIADMVELDTEPLVPYDYNKPWGQPHLQTSFKAVPISDNEGWIEVELGYSAIDPRDGFDYAEYTHTGIDYRTGNLIKWQKATAQREYLIKGIVRTEGEAMKLIEGDYLSLFRGAIR